MKLHIYSKMYIAKEIKVLDYESNIPQSMIIDLIEKSKFFNSGIYEMILEPNKQLQQKGPFILPPPRWAESFSKSDRIYIKCKIANDERNS